ncbi:Uncharacterised protein [Yersinia nurmii]|uniref:Uncharacterized protein n=2 Tax=Yersinia nurmii TaxID=685706 RepID=A0ABM9S3W2_9GAMM|nr:Uncharacterised protein [Yersinia nurmii]
MNASGYQINRTRMGNKVMISAKLYKQVSDKSITRVSMGYMLNIL